MIEKKVAEIISPVYLVGGSIRDRLLDKPPKDWDFCTPLSPDEIEERVKATGHRAYLIGKKFGTIGFKLDGEFVEVTTFRTEKYEKNSRKPKVEFVKNISHDLSRRDFTINAMAKRIRLDTERKRSKIIDNFGGQEDLKNKIIKCVGNPRSRFKEDPLRILRVGRFMAQLGFSVEEQTKQYAKELAYKILHISKERWVTELDKLLISDDVVKGLEFLAEIRLFNFMIPELSLQVGYSQNSPHHYLNLWEHTLKVVYHTPKDIILRWAALLHDVGKPFVRTENTRGHSNYIRHDYLGGEIVEKTARYLKWSNERREKVKEIVLYHLSQDSILKEFDNKAKDRK